MAQESKQANSDMSEAARAMGKQRWQGMSEAERKDFMAKARAKIKLTKAERSEIGRRAVNARWAKAKAVKQTEKPTGRTKRTKASKAVRIVDELQKELVVGDTFGGTPF